METTNGQARQGIAVLEEKVAGCQAQSRAAGERLAAWQKSEEQRVDAMEKCLAELMTESTVRKATLDVGSKIYVGILALAGPILVVLLQYLLK
jgi:hypothetical protein